MSEPEPKVITMIKLVEASGAVICLGCDEVLMRGEPGREAGLALQEGDCTEAMWRAYVEHARRCDVLRAAIKRAEQQDYERYRKRLN